MQTKHILVILILLLTLFRSEKGNCQDSCQLRISILTCGSAEELYSSYGHSAVRIIDSCKGTDIVYNYGTFNFGDPDFYLKFTRGKLEYYLNDESFEGFLSLYREEHRTVQEQVLRLPAVDALAVSDFLQNNLKEENRYYKYDFLFDNCSSRIRDVFANLFQQRIQFPTIISNDSISFRVLLDHYERNLHWERFGINLLMSNLVDNKMKSYETMFLPDYLFKGFAGATLDGNQLVASTATLLSDNHFSENKLNEPKCYLWVLLGVIFFLSFFKKADWALKFFDVFFFMILGLLGGLMLFMWFGTEHKVCAWNLNLLWAFPLHLVFAFMIPRNSAKISQYAKYTSWLLIAAIFYNIFAPQKYMSEITPLLILILLRLNHYSKQIRRFSYKTS